MSRRKRNKQVTTELENQAVHNVEPVNEHKDINESERIQRAEWIHDQVKLQREREDETWEKIMEEQKLITERMRSIDDDISRNRELERYHEGCLEDITDQVYSLHGVTTDKLEGMTRYKNAKFQGEATVVFVMSIMIAAIAAYAYGVTSQVCMFMLLCIGAEGALLSGPHKKRNLLGGIFRTLFFVPVILMAAEVISFKYYENYYEYVTMIGEAAAILLVRWLSLLITSFCALPLAVLLRSHKVCRPCSSLCTFSLVPAGGLNFSLVAGASGLSPPITISAVFCSRIWCISTSLLKSISMLSTLLLPMSTRIAT